MKKIVFMVAFVVFFCGVGHALQAEDKAYEKNTYKGFGVGIDYRSFQSTLKMNYAPLIKIGYESLERNQLLEYGLGLGFSLGEIPMTQSIILSRSDQPVTATLDKLSVIILEGKLRKYFEDKIHSSEGWFLSGDFHLMFTNNTQSNSGMNGYELGGGVGHYFKVSERWFIEPEIKVDYTSFTSEKLKGEIVGFKNSLDGFDIHFEIGSSYYF